MALTKEELEELATLDKEEQLAREAQDDAMMRQRLDAKRMRKRLAEKHGMHGRDFVVVETTAGINFAFRRPHDVEVDALDNAPEEEARAALEKFIAAITIEPKTDVVQATLAAFPGLGPSFAPAIKSMTGRVREEEAKK